MSQNIDSIDKACCLPGFGSPVGISKHRVRVINKTLHSKGMNVVRLGPVAILTQYNDCHIYYVGGV